MINAPVEVVFPQVAIYKNWEAWSPWLLKDPTIKTTYAGPEGQVGASQSWTSKQSGTGTQTTTKLEVNPRIETHLEFGGMGRANSYWGFHPIDSGTHVVWGFTTTFDSIPSRYFGLAMQSAVSGDYELGLSRLKTLAESLPIPQPQPASAPTGVSRVDDVGAAPVTSTAQ